MKRLSQATMALLLTGLVLVMISGAALAQNGAQTWQEAYPLESYGPNQIVLEKYSEAVASVQNRDMVHPVEYYGAYQIAQAEMNIAWDSAQNRNKIHPDEYDRAIPLAMAQYNPALMGEQGWDSTHTAEYFSVLLSSPDTAVALESVDLSSDTATCNQC